MNTARPRVLRRIAAVVALALVASLSGLASAPAMAAGVSGTLTVEIQESVDASHNIAGKDVQLWIAGSGIIEYGTTGLNGIYAFSTVLDSLQDYQIYIEPGDPYVDVSVDNLVDVTSNTMVVNLVPVAGTIVGSISNWNSTLVDSVASGDGTYTILWRFDVVDNQWEEVDYTGLIYNNWYRVAGVYDTGDYLVSVHPFEGANFYATASDGSPVSNVGLLYGTGFAGNPAGEVNVGSVALLGAGFIEGTLTARDGTVPPAIVYVVSDFPDFLDPAIVEITNVDSNGDWNVRVPSGTQYLAVAQDYAGDFTQLVWNDHLFSFCPCGIDYDPISVTLGVVTPGIDFELVPFDTSVLFDVYLSELDLSNLPDELDLADVKVHLYRAVTGGWQEVDTNISGESGGAYVAGSTSGSYRLRFSVGTDWLPFTEYTDDNGDDYTVAASCYLDVTGTTLGDYLLYDFLIDTEATSPACGPEAAVSSGSGTTTHSSGHKRARTTEAPVLVLPTPTASPTPTPTPTKTSSPDETATPTPAPVPTPGGFNWWIWILIALGVLIACSVIFFIVRRR